MQVDASGMRVDSIQAISEHICVIRTVEGIFAVGRTCPHSGADLANAYIKDGMLRCAWHNLPFDPRTGRQPCASLPNLRTYPLTRLQKDLYELELGAPESSG